jgi:hypothetical protein
MTHKIEVVANVAILTVALLIGIHNWPLRQR